MKMAVTQYEIYTKRFEGLRFIAYLKDIVTAYENIKEMKIYHVHDFFRGHIIKQYDGYIKEDKKIRSSFLQKTVSDRFGRRGCNLNFKYYITLRLILDERTIGDFSLYINFN